MKEYGIYIRDKQGSPYMLDKFKTIESAKSKLLEMVELEEERERSYFVDNDFFINKYCTTVKLKYFQIREREVTDWMVFSSEISNYHEKDNIIYFDFHKKLLTK